MHADLRELAQNRANHDTQKQAKIFADLVRRLAAAGASAAAVTSMGGHFCIAELEAISALPIVNAIPEVDAAIRQRNLKTIGILTAVSSLRAGGLERCPLSGWSARSGIRPRLEVRCRNALARLARAADLLQMSSRDIDLAVTGERRSHFDRKLKHETVSRSLWASTVFLGFDYNFSGKGPPLLLGNDDTWRRAWRLL